MSHFELQSNPTQDKFLDFLQHDFSKIDFLQKAFLFEWGASALRLRGPDGPRPPIQIKKLFEEDLAFKNHVAKSQVIYLESEADGSVKWQKIM